MLPSMKTFSIEFLHCLTNVIALSIFSDLNKSNISYFLLTKNKNADLIVLKFTKKLVYYLLFN